jgi:hypothetical protein
MGSGESEPAYFGVFINNQIIDNRWGFRLWTLETDVGIGALGNVFRHNTINGTLQQAVRFYATDDGANGGPMSDMNVVEFTTATNVRIGVNMVGPDGSVRNVVTRRNSFDLGTATYAGSKGVAFYCDDGAGHLRENTWTGFETTYYYYVPGPVLELPYRVLEAELIVGSTAQIVLPIWNAGTDALDWSASSDAAWLTLPVDNGSLPDESASYDLPLDLDAAGLAPGSYVGTVTVTGSTQKATVLLTVAETYHPGDANGDGVVDLTDLGRLAGNWQQSPRDWSQGDFNGDQVVDLTDLGILAANWGYGTSALLRTRSPSTPVSLLNAWHERPVTDLGAATDDPLAEQIADDTEPLPQVMQP